MLPATSNFITALGNFKSGKIVYAVEIATYPRIFTNYDDGISGHYPWLGDIDDLSQTLSDLDGGADQISLGFAVQDRAAAITSDFPGFVFEGKLCTIKMGFVGLAYSDYMTVFTGFIDSVASINSNLDYYFELTDLTQLLSQVVFTAGDNGLPTSSTNVKTVQGHPLDILLDILETELGISTGLIDVANIQDFRDNIFSGVEMKFVLDQAPAAGDFIKVQLLKPLGGYLWSAGAGLFSCHFFYPQAGPVSVMSLDPSNMTFIPTAEQTDMVNTVQMQFDKTTGSSSYASQDTEEYGPSVALYGQFGEDVIQADGVRSVLQGFFIAKFTARLIFLRYGFKNLKFDQQAPDVLIPSVRLEPGDIVAVTHPDVPDRKAGVMGITNKLFEVIGKTYKWQDGLTTLVMIDADYLSTFGFFKIAPDGHAAYTASSTGDKAKYMFMCNDSDQYSDTSPANVLG